MVFEKKTKIHRSNLFKFDHQLSEKLEPKFLLISHADGSQKLNKISLFLINKVISDQAASQVKNIKQFRNGVILVETFDNKQPRLLLKLTNLSYEIPVKVEPHQKLNSSKGEDLVDIPKEVILSE